MPKFMIEREIPGAGSMSADEFKAAAQNSCSVIKELGPQIQWLESFVTDNKVFCVFIAPNEEMIRKHAEKGSIPLNSVRQIKRTIDPSTAE
ncbi:DUF4242 domain-containing protein [bacterium]|jgi:hypothetical protein|nr:DUF4242 domain-containing protein [bacterium]